MARNNRAWRGGATRLGVEFDDDGEGVVGPAAQLLIGVATLVLVVEQLAAVLFFLGVVDEDAPHARVGDPADAHADLGIREQVLHPVCLAALIGEKVEPVAIQGETHLDFVGAPVVAIKGGQETGLGLGDLWILVGSGAGHALWCHDRVPPARRNILGG